MNTLLRPRPLPDLLQRSARVRYTCLHASSSLLVFGANTGRVYVFKTPDRSFVKLVSPPDVDRAVSCVAISPCGKMIAVASDHGPVHILELRTDTAKAVEKSLMKVMEHKNSKVTYLKWDPAPDSRRLFCGDDAGLVTACRISTSGSVADLFRNLRETKAEILVTLESAVVQIDVSCGSLLVSCLTRALMIDLNDKAAPPRQIGSQPRNGPFGACFKSSTDVREVLCARPGRRIWVVDGTQCTVRTTIQKLVLSPSAGCHPDVGGAPAGMQYQFSVIHLASEFLFSWGKGLPFFLVDVMNAEVLEWHTDLHNILSASVVGSTIYVLHSAGSDSAGGQMVTVMERVELHILERLVEMKDWLHCAQFACRLKILDLAILRKIYDGLHSANASASLAPSEMTRLDELIQHAELCDKLGTARDGSRDASGASSSRHLASSRSDRGTTATGSSGSPSRSPTPLSASPNVNIGVFPSVDGDDTTLKPIPLPRPIGSPPFPLAAASNQDPVDEVDSARASEVGSVIGEQIRERSVSDGTFETPVLPSGPAAESGTPVAALDAESVERKKQPRFLQDAHDEITIDENVANSDFSAALYSPTANIATPKSSRKSAKSSRKTRRSTLRDIAPPSTRSEGSSLMGRPGSPTGSEMTEGSILSEYEDRIVSNLRSSFRASSPSVSTMPRGGDMIVGSPKERASMSRDSRSLSDPSAEITKATHNVLLSFRRNEISRQVLESALAQWLTSFSEKTSPNHLASWVRELITACLEYNVLETTYSICTEGAGALDGICCSFLRRFQDTLEIEKATVLCNDRGLMASVEFLIGLKSDIVDIEEQELLEDRLAAEDGRTSLTIVERHRSLWLTLRHIKVLFQLVPNLAIDFAVRMYPLMTVNNVRRAIPPSEDSVFTRYMCQIMLKHPRCRSDGSLVETWLRGCFSEQAPLKALLFADVSERRFVRGAHEHTWIYGHEAMKAIDNPSAYAISCEKLVQMCYEYGFVRGLVRLLRSNRSITDALRIVVDCEDIDGLTDILTDSRGVAFEDWEHAATWILGKDAPHMKEVFVKLLSFHLDSSQSLALLSRHESLLDGLGSEPYELIIAKADIEVKRRATLHQMLTKVNHHFWPHKNIALAPQIQLVREMEADGTAESQLPYVSRSVATGMLEPAFDSRGGLPRYFEDVEGHWGVRVSLSSGVCLCCSLPLAGPGGESVLVFPCGHAYHKQCIPEEACLECFEEKFTSILK